jgi:hypothetical protein
MEIVLNNIRENLVKLTEVLVSSPEARLIDSIQAIYFGEMFGVEIPSEDPKKADTMLFRELSPAMLDLILYTRAGCQYIDVLTVHNGQPTLAETNLKLGGFRCRKQIRFPTIPTEG